MNKYNKIAIIGGTGTGKTTLSNKLGEKLKLPVYHIDAIHHLENWQVRDEKERDKMIQDIVSKKQWILDGTYRSTLNERVKNADLTIFLDYSTLARLKGVITRYLKAPNKEKPDIPGCQERINLKYIKWTYNWNKSRRDFITKVLENNKNKNIIIFKNRRQLNKWYNNINTYLDNENMSKIVV